MTPTSRPEPPPAGFWQRELAWLLDAALLGAGAHVVLALWAALSLPLPAVLEGEALRALLARALALAADPWAMPEAVWPLLAELLRALLAMTAVATAAYALLAAPYFVLQEAGRHRATPGKRALGLQVLDSSGRPCSAARAGSRHLAATLSWLSLNLGHALAAWTPSKRALHDRLSGTRVIAATPALPGWGRVLVAVQVAVLLGLPLLALLLVLAATLLMH